MEAQCLLTSPLEAEVAGLGSEKDRKFVLHLPVVVTDVSTQLHKLPVGQMALPSLSTEQHASGVLAGTG